jgi:hypothetical protein
VHGGLRLLAHRWLIATAVVGVAGCTLLAELDAHEASVAGGDDASTDATSTEGSVDDAVAPVGPELPAPCVAGGTIFVSSSKLADDANPGDSYLAPKATVVAAIAAAKGADDAGPVKRCVAVCNGTYSTARIQIEDPISLYGGFDCGTWKRPPLDIDNPLTILASDPVSSTGSLLIIGGPRVGRDTIVEGFRFDHAKGSTINVGALGEPTIRFNQILNRSAQAVARAILIGNSSPEIANNQIIAHPVGAALPAEAIYISTDSTATKTEPWIHDNDIAAFDGVASTSTVLPVGSMGVYVQGHASVKMTRANKNPFANNRVILRSGSSPIDGFDSIAFDVEGSNNNSTAAMQIDIVNSLLQAGPGAGGVRGRAGVRLVGAGQFVVEGNRISGGSEPDAGADLARYVVGVVCEKTTGAVITNDFIFAGHATDNVPIAGVYLQAATGTVIRHDTIFVDAASAGVGRGFHVYADATTKGTVVQNNVLAGSRQRVTGVGAQSCAIGGSVDVLDHNLFFASDVALVGRGSQLDGGANACPAWKLPDDIAGGASDAGADAAGYGGNLLFVGDASCNGCVPGCDPLSVSCQATFFADWTRAGTNLDAGWRLNATTSRCAYARGGVDLTQAPQGVKVDAFGATRTPQVSMGAHELDTPCIAP